MDCIFENSITNPFRNKKDPNIKAHVERRKEIFIKNISPVRTKYIIIIIFI